MISSHFMNQKCTWIINYESKYNKFCLFCAVLIDYTKVNDVIQYVEISISMNRE
jgi:hypothetical protein